VILFIWLADRYSPLTAAVIVFGLFLMLAVVGAVAALVAHRNAAASAEKALTRQGALSLSSRLISKPPSNLPTGLDGGNSFQSWGWDFSRLVSRESSACATG
jgi:hypothetical protein